MSNPGGNDDILDLAPIRTRGRSPRALTAEVIRPLSPADLCLLEVDRESKAPAVARFRDSHHRVARCFASGMRPAQVALQTGYSHSRLSILQADPAFRDLVEVYRKDGAEAFAEYQDVALGNMIRGERLLEEALEAAADRETPLDLGELRPIMDIVSDRADRFGHPKTQANVNLNIDFAGRLSEARKRSGLLQSPSSSEAPEKEPAA
jgi:hypothetical protein